MSESVARRAGGIRGFARVKKWLAGGLSAALAVGMLAAGGATAAHAADPASLRIFKTVTVDGETYDLPETPHVGVDEEFQWNIEIVCDQITDQCVNATLTDAVPAEFEIVEAGINTGAIPSDVSVVGQNVTVRFLEPLTMPSGAVGLSATAFVTIPVKLRAIPVEQDGDVFTNTASVVADNAPLVSDSAAVTADVEFTLLADASKAFDPTSTLAEEGAPVSLTFGGANASNGAVDTLVVQDPIDPAASPNIFQQYLQLDGLTAATWPDGAESAVVSVYDVSTSTWVDAPAVAAPGALVLPAVDPADRGGIRFTFTSVNPAIPVGATTSVQLALSQRASVSGILADTALSNVSTAQVSVGGEDSPVDQAPASVTLRPASTAVEASKDITPPEIAVSGSTTQATVTLGAENTGTRSLETLTIAEPSNPADLSANNLMAPAFPGGGVTFAGFGAVEWPTGATAVSITYHFADGSTETAGSTTLNTLPEPVSTERVTGFGITFTGDIVEGAEATVPFTVDASETDGTQFPGGRNITGLNQITVSGTTPGVTPDPAPDTAEDDLTIFAEQISIVTEKSLTHDRLYSIPGQTTTARLKTTILPYPQTTRNATRVIIDDPSTTTGVTDWYEHFNATAITLTQIPANATLTVQWRNAAGTFADIPGMVDISGGTIFSAPITSPSPDLITGIRFVYTSTDGFVPGQELVPNITYTTRANFRTINGQGPIPSNHADPEESLETPLFSPENCSASEATNATLGLDSGRVEVAPPCPIVDLMPTGPGVGPGIDKEWNPDLVFSHSRQNTTVNLRWSAGVQNLDEVVIADVATDPATGLPAQLGAASVFDTFNLTRIGPISDPLFAYDQVQVQVFDGTSWSDLSSCTAAAPCTGGTIPAINLTTTQQATTVAVRFIVSEKPGRTPTDPSQPLPGTGVAVGARTIPLTLQLRDTTRTAPHDPVVEGPVYNSGTTPSEVLNTSSIEGYVDDVRTHRDTDDDTIVIQDLTPAVSTTKTWEGGPIAIPSDWTVQTPPTTRVSLATVNQTAGVIQPGNINVGGRVSELRIVDPGHVDPLLERSPFEEFDLVRFHSLTVPAGTEGIEIQFAGAGAPATIATDPGQPGTPAAQAWAALQALPVSELRAVTGITVIFRGHIESGAANGTGGLQFDLELRQFERSNPTVAVTTTNSPVDNTVRGTVSDKRWNPVTEGFVDRVLGDDDEASVSLVGGSLSVVSTKSFSPTFQTEPNNPEVTMTLGATPGGSERTRALVLTDDRATFWNGYDFKRVANSFTLPGFAPGTNPLQVEFSVCTGRDFDADEIEADPALGCEATGGTWSAYTAPVLPAAAQGWAPADPENVQGIRVRITRQGDVQWENPRNPTVTVPLVIERRADLRSGGAVPSTLNDGEDPAPGQAVKGFTVNTVRADVTGIWGGAATHSSDATIEYRHTRNAVQVVKQPIGVKSPGIPFDYTLTVVNSGDRDIVDPVITDRLPYDATLGTLVQFDPDANPATPRYAFSLSGTNPASDPMPTWLDDGDDGVVVAEDLASTTPTIAFTFPDGTRLAPGQTYTIVFKMMFVAGVVENQPVVNGFDISGDRVWDECGVVPGNPGHSAQLLNDDTECSTTAQVTPQRLASIRGVKSVRAVNPAGGYNNHGFADDDVCANRVDGQSYAFQPCVPRTMPGQTEQWRLTVTNNGTTPMNRVVVADYLPRPGDSTLIANFPRNSQWTPVLQGTAPTMAGIAGTLTSYVTTAAKASICMAGVNNPTDAQLASCIDAAGGVAEAATRFVPFANLSADELEDVTALLFVVDPATPNGIAPGAVIDIGFETETGPYSVQDAADPRAYNSLTVSALYPRTNAPDAPMNTLTSRDQSNVGVGLITGSIRIEKEVAGPGAGFVPDDQVFSGTLQCTSAGQPIPDRPFTVTVDEPTVIRNLPAGALCTAVETAASGQTSYTSSTVTVLDDRVADPEDLPTIEIANVYELTELVVTKTVQSDAELIPTGFGFTVVCTFLGQEIELDEDDASFTLDDGGSHTITGLPVNAECTVTETDDRGADYVDVEAESLDADDEPWGTVTEGDSDAVIDRLAPSTGSNAAGFTNVYGDFAAIRVEKDLVGGAADLGEDLTFSVQVVCTFEGETLLDQLVPLNRGNGWGTTLSSLVAGSECTITEPSLNGADAVVITPNDGDDTTTGIVTIPSEATEPVVVAVTNRYLAGSIEVEKLITGDGAELYGTGDFTVQLVCTLNDEPVRVIDGATRTLNAENLTAEYTGIPSGADCVLTEPENAGATESRIRIGQGDWADAGDPGVGFTVVVDPAIVSNDDQAQTPAELENRFDLAEISVTKNVVSDAVDQNGEPIEYGPFEVVLSCTFEGEQIDIPEGAERTLANGETVTWTTLPAGALCTVEETDAADADEVWFELPDASAEEPGEEGGEDAPPVRVDGQVLELAPLVPVGDETAVNAADLFNAFDSTRLTIVKQLVGDGAQLGKDKAFEVELVCTLTDATRPEGAEVWNETLTLSAANDWRAEVEGLASGAECRIAEIERGGADRTQISAGDVVIGASAGGFTADDADIRITVANTFHAPLSTTGGTAVGYLAMLAALLMLAGGAAAAMRRKEGRHSAAE